MFTLKMYDEDGQMVDEVKVVKDFDEFMELVNENVGKSVIVASRFKEDKAHYYGSEFARYRIADKVEENVNWEKDFSDRWGYKRTPDMIEEELEEYEGQVELWAIEDTSDGDWKWREKIALYSADDMVQVDIDTGITMWGVTC